MNKIYLDYAAATPIDASVLEAMRPYFEKEFYNPSATYLAARRVADDIEKAKQNMSHWLGCRPSELVCTAGGTEANNLAIRGIMEQYPDCNVIVSSIEHESVLKPAELYEHALAPVDEQGVLNLKKLEGLINKKTVLISIMLANNEIGSIQPIKQTASIIETIRKSRQKAGNTLPLYLHVDACQAAAYLDLHVSRLGVDMMTLNGGKIYGPKQSGILYVRAGIKLSPQVVGGGQEHGLRSGTENVAGIVGMSAALDLVQSRRAIETKRMHDLQTHFFKLLQTKIPDALINGSRKQRLPNNVHITLQGHDNERLMMQLDERGIMCAVGSACSASSEEPSHVLKAIGLGDSAAQSSLRFTMGSKTTKDDVDTVIQVLTTLL